MANASSATAHTQKKLRPIMIGLMLLAVFYIAIQIYFNALLGWHANQYAELSKSFLQGQLSFSEEYVAQVAGWDMSYSNGKYYWPLGPFPAIVLMPIVALEPIIPLQTSQSVGNIIFALITAYATYAIARKIGYTEKDSLVWVAAICLGSTFIGVSTFSSSWYLAHTISVALVLLSLLEFMGKKRPLLIGTMMAAVFASRLTAGIGIIFFFLAFLFGEGSLSEKSKKIFLLCLPMAVCVLLLAGYNLVRFDTLTNTGYERQEIPDVVVVENREDKGMFSIAHLPRNLSFMFFGTPLLYTLTDADGNQTITLPVFDPRGMSIFLTAPWLLVFFTLSYRKKLHWQLFATAGLIAGVILLWHSTGCVQFGHRLTLDFLPYILLAFMTAYFAKQQHLSTNIKIVMALGILVNIGLVLTAVLLDIAQNICSL
jgi:hypothetical protein